MQLFANKKFTHTAFGVTTEVQIHIEWYYNSRPCIQLMSPMEEAPEMLEPYMTASTNLPDSPCPEGEVFIKNYSENEGIVEWLVRAGVLMPEATYTVISGYVTISRYRFTLAAAADMLAGLPAFLKKGN